MANDIALPSGGQLPAYFQKYQNLPSIAENVLGGLNASAHHRITIKGARWRIFDVQGNETVHPSLTLDVVIVGANQALSKVFYSTAYNPNDEDKAPDCWSDNGTGPSSRAEKPQSATCDLCPHQVWGSKVTAQGNKTRACGDFKKLAVLLAHDLEGPVYELRVPPASLGNLGNISKAMQSRGIPLPAGVMQLAFDPTSDFPKIVFGLASYLPEQWADYVMNMTADDEVTDVIGSKDVARTAPITSLPAQPTQALQPPANLPNTQFQPQVPQTPTVMPQQPVMQQPPQMPPQFDPNAGNVPHFQHPQPISQGPYQAQPISQGPQPPMIPPQALASAPASPEAPKRTRKPRAAPAPQQPQQAPQQPQQALPGYTVAYQDPQQAPQAQPAQWQPPQVVVQGNPPQGQPMVLQGAPIMQQPGQVQMPPRDAPFAQPAAGATNGMVAPTNAQLDAMLGDALK